MKAISYLSMSVLGLSTAFTCLGADSFSQVADHAAEEYTKRLQTATTELNEARQTILREQQPLADANRKLEDQVTALEAEIAQLEMGNAQKSDRRQQLTREAGTLRKNLNYFTTLAQDTLKTANDSLLPGESAFLSEQLQTLQQNIEGDSRGIETSAAMGMIDFMLKRMERQLGGYAVTGTALIGDDNRLAPGTFAFIGPEAFFRAQSGAAGTVRTREGSNVAVTYPLDHWDAAKQAAFFSGENGTMLGDPSGGKALRLREINGTIWQHIQRGGTVAYAILLVGLLAIVIAIQKLVDLRRLGVDAAPAVQQALVAVRHGSKTEMEAALTGLKSTTRELFTTGVKHFEKPKRILEEHLFARTLQIRLHYERRLPLLAVIATAAPLMGLLGTVMGMIKTFALITVFGTGNAGKLSGGISEVLVATELGLMVAIPALVAHGFLAHRIQKSLSLLDRYAVEFLTAAEEAKTGTRDDELVST